MSSVLHAEPAPLIGLYGYWIIALIVGLESIGIPLPGETTLITAAGLAGAGHAGLSLEGIILAAVVGAVVGDTIGYWIGRRIGFPVLLHYGARIGLNQPRLKLGHYLFNRHGGKIVFFGRFVAVLRVAPALLAGANRMPWLRFLAFNAAGALAWATLVGSAAYRARAEPISGEEDNPRARHASAARSGPRCWPPDAGNQRPRLKWRSHCAPRRFARTAAQGNPPQDSSVSVNPLVEPRTRWTPALTSQGNSRLSAEACLIPFCSRFIP